MMKADWDGTSLWFEGQDWRGKRVRVIPNTMEISLELFEEAVHIRLPDPSALRTLSVPAIREVMQNYTDNLAAEDAAEAERVRPNPEWQPPPDAPLLGMRRSPERRDRLVRDIASAINRNSAENQSGTPDFILAQLLVGCLESYEDCCRLNREWHRPPGPTDAG